VIGSKVGFPDGLGDECPSFSHFLVPLHEVHDMVLFPYMT
jgi:hypothetical protein